MIDLVQNTIDGLVVGSTYAMLALGFTLIFGVMRRLNLAYGPSIMIGAYAGTYFHVELGAPWYAVALATVGGAAVAGAYVERLCFAPMRSAGQAAAVASMVSSFAIWMQLEELATLVLPQHSYPFPTLVGAAPLALGPFHIRAEHLLILACAVALMAFLRLALYGSRFGLAVRALTENPHAARVVGIDVPAATFRSFLLASAIGGLAGYLIVAADTQVTAMLGMWSTFKGLIAMMLGGLGSFPGAVVGGLVLGVIEAHSQWHLGPQGRDLVAYLLLFAVLVIRPGGLFGGAAARVALDGGRRR
jgi:branched-subunit amino acid ABC-type transport system permease component